MTNYRLSKLSPLTQLPTSDENRPHNVFSLFRVFFSIYQIFPIRKYDSAPYLWWESPSQWRGVFSRCLKRINDTYRIVKIYDYKISCQNIFPISYWSATFTLTDSIICSSAFSYLSTVLLKTVKKISKHKKILERFLIT